MNARTALSALSALLLLACASCTVARDRSPPASTTPAAPAAAILTPAPLAPPVASSGVAVWSPLSTPSVDQTVAPQPVRSPSLRNPELHSPMPGGFIGGWVGDTGLDIMGSPRPVFALAAGTLDYSEEGHTLWTGKRDTPNSVRIELDHPIAFKNRQITHVYYTHLSKLEVVQHEGDTPRRHVDAGEQVGTSGTGNGVMHLHVGLLLDGKVEQDSWDTLLVASDVRVVLGGYRNGESLPKM